MCFYPAAVIFLCFKIEISLMQYDTQKAYFLSYGNFLSHSSHGFRHNVAPSLNA